MARRRGRAANTAGEATRRGSVRTNPASWPESHRTYSGWPSYTHSSGLEFPDPGDKTAGDRAGSQRSLSPPIFVLVLSVFKRVVLIRFQIPDVFWQIFCNPFSSASTSIFCNQSYSFFNSFRHLLNLQVYILSRLSKVIHDNIWKISSKVCNFGMIVTRLFHKPCTSFVQFVVWLTDSDGVFTKSERSVSLCWKKYSTKR